jgi:hypothetical protein
MVSELTKCRTKQMNNLFVKTVVLGALLMGEEKVNIQELAQKVDELLNVLNVIAGDLAEVSKSLKSVSGPAAAPAISAAPAASSEKKRGINEVKQEFSAELAGMLLFEENGSFVIVKPRRFLGSDNFAKIASVVRELGGEYVSAGRNSHFKIGKN